jgi:mRNA interferase MazF
VAFDPAMGGEIRKTRPALVVSNDAANRLLNRIQVVPLTSRFDRLPRRSLRDASKVRGAKLRLRGQIGRLDAADMTAVDRAIRTQLAL